MLLEYQVVSVQLGCEVRHQTEYPESVKQFRKDDLGSKENKLCILGWDAWPVI